MTLVLRGIALAALCAVLGACATPAPPVIITPEEEYEPERVQVPSPLVEYPPIEPVEPPMAPSPAADPPVAGAFWRRAGAWRIHDGDGAAFGRGGAAGCLA